MSESTLHPYILNKAQQLAQPNPKSSDSELLDVKEKLEQKIAELDLLYKIQRELNHSHDLDSLIRSITRKTLKLINGQSSALTLIERDQRRMYILNNHPPLFYTRLLAPGDTIAEQVIQSGEPYLCRHGDCRLVPGPTRAAKGMTIQNMIAVPLFDNDVCIGALEVFNLMLTKDDDSIAGFTNDDVKVLTIIASQIASAVVARHRREAEEKENRLASIGQMISGILHDYKTPFTVISGYMQLMAETDDQELREKYAEIGVKQFAQINELTHELLMFARGDTNILLRNVLIHQFMDRVRDLLNAELASKNINVVLDLKYRGEIRIDESKIIRAILNLARNAADAMPDGGTFTIGASIDSTTDPDNKALVLTFADTGSGIDPALQGRIFESFVTHGKANGTGLGLAVVQKIVHDHHGTISFESSPTTGTTFFIRIPHS